MNAEIKTKWLEALKSGKYVQGRGKLRHDGKYCCLGVLCDVVDPSRWSTPPSWFPIYEFDGCSGQIPDDMGEWLGIGPQLQKTLIGMNDVQRLSFKSIADWIERNL